jgi:hypothetical protein
MLSHLQHRKLKAHEEYVASLRANYNTKLKDKDNSIRKLEEEMTNFKNSLKGCNFILILVITESPTKSRQINKITKFAKK